MRTALIIVAAGAGTRMGGAIRKPFIELTGKMVIEHTLDAFGGIEWLDRVVVVLSKSDFSSDGDSLTDATLESRLRRAGAREFTEGGSERIESVMNGVNAANDCDLLLIHDGVRPFVTRELIERVRTSTIQYGCAVPGVRLRDTVRFIDEASLGAGTPDRSTLRAIQTPQGFRREVLLNAVTAWRARHEAAASVTDEAMLVESNGGKVAIVDGEIENTKLTEPNDIAFAEWKLLRKNTH